MTRVLFLFAVFLFPQKPAATPARPASVATSWSLGDTLHSLAAKPNSDTVFASLTEIGLANHLPLGIVFQPALEGSTDKNTLCRTELVFSSTSLRLEDLISELQAALPADDIRFRQGTLEILPHTLLPGTRALLDLHLDSFKSSPATRYWVAYMFWTWVAAKLDPMLGSAYAGPVPTSAPIPGLDLRDTSTEDTLDLLATRGTGGLWYLDATHLQKLDAHIMDPFAVYGYDGDQSDITYLDPCSSGTPAKG